MGPNERITEFCQWCELGKALKEIERLRGILKKALSHGSELPPDLNEIVSEVMIDYWEDLEKMSNGNDESGEYCEICGGQTNDGKVHGKDGVCIGRSESRE